MPAISGFVFDSSGAPIRRELRFYRRDTGARLGVTTSGVDDGDPHYDKVVLLLPMDGANGSTAFVDNSAAVKSVTANGNAKISTAQSKWGGASLLLDGNEDYLSVPAHADFVFGTGDFTIEMWGNTTTTEEKVLVDQYGAGNANSWQFAVRGGRLSWYTGGYFLTGSAAVNNGAWHHVAAARSAGILRFFVDGVLDGSAALSANYASQAVLGIGAQVASRNPSYDFPGRIDDLRITKGVARYTANFTPPTAALPDRLSAGRILAPGEYYFSTTYSGEVQVVCIDDADEPLENDLILRTFPV